MGWKYHSPPGWPEPPEDWTPPAGWRPDPAWPSAPEGWQFWVSDGADDPTLMFELPPDEGPFTSLDELINHPRGERPDSGTPRPGPTADAVTARSASDAAVEATDVVVEDADAADATDVDPSPQPVLATAMDAAEQPVPADQAPADVWARPATEAVAARDATMPPEQLPEPVPTTAHPQPAPVLAVQTAMAMDAAAAPDAVWSDQRPRPVWPVDPAMTAEPAWIAEPAPEPALADTPPPAWTDEPTSPAWVAAPAMSAEPAWAGATDAVAAAQDTTGAAPAFATAPDTTGAAPAFAATAPELTPATMSATSEPVAVEREPAVTPAMSEPVGVEREPVVMAATSALVDVETVDAAAIGDPVAAAAEVAEPEPVPVAAPLTSGIAWPAFDPKDAEEPEPVPVGVPTAGVPLTGVPVMAFAAEPTPAPASPPPGTPPGTPHLPAHAASHVPAHAATRSRRPWWIWGLAGAAGLLLCAMVGVGGFLAVRWGDGGSTAVAEPGATAVGTVPEAEASKQAQARPIPSPSSQAAQAQPQDQIFEGEGPQTVPVELGNTFHTVALTYMGTGAFVVRTVKADGQEIQTLVSAAESYEGVRPLDLGEIRPDAVSIQADGGWRMVVRPLASAQTFSGNASGVGADVLLIPRTAAESVKVAFDHRGTGKFTVQAIGSDSATLISQEGDFTGETMLPRGTVVVVIDTNGVWTFSRE
ncbi:hypothetical protein [Catellatospora methionotrophica]|nr:hypothetical protein [Catellatospora methionotrophica]